MEYRRGIVVMKMDYSILEHKDTMYISFLGDKETNIEVFKNYKYFDSLQTKIFPKAIDNEGNIYTIDESDFPKVQKFRVRIK